MAHLETQYDEVKDELIKAAGASDIQVHGSNLVAGSVTAAKVAADVATQAELDAVSSVANAALPASSYTAADVLTKIKTVDGSGSGLDADTVDGIQGANIITTTGGQTINGELGFAGGGKIGDDGSSATYIKANGHSFNVIKEDNSGYLLQVSTSTVNSPSGFSWNGTEMAQTRLNAGKLEFWNGTDWIPAGVQAAKGTTAANSSGAGSVGGLLFEPKTVFVRNSVLSVPFFLTSFSFVLNNGAAFADDEQRVFTYNYNFDTTVSSSFGGSDLGSNAITLNSSGFSFTGLRANESVTWIAFGQIPT
jgi:hypothetical protein